MSITENCSLEEGDPEISLYTKPDYSQVPWCSELPCLSRCGSCLHFQMILKPAFQFLMNHKLTLDRSLQNRESRQHIVLPNFHPLWSRECYVTHKSCIDPARLNLSNYVKPALACRSHSRLLCACKVTVIANFELWETSINQLSSQVF